MRVKKAQFMKIKIFKTLR